MSLPARELVPLLQGLKIDDPGVSDARDLLVRWDKVLSRDSAAAVIYEYWLTALNLRLSKLLIPSEAAIFFRSGVSLTQMIRVLRSADPKIFGANGSNPTARRDELLIESLAESVKALRGSGVDMKDWRWGDLHIAEFNHPLSTSDSRRAVFDLKPVPRGGDGNTVNATGGARFTQRSGASFREILDLSDWDKSVAINVPGQSAQPGSSHYGDLLPLWAEGKYFPLLFSRAKIEKNAVQKLLLQPKQASQAATKE
jgi:penicillin amidase